MEVMVVPSRSRMVLRGVTDSPGGTVSKNAFSSFFSFRTVDRDLNPINLQFLLL